MKTVFLKELRVLIFSATSAILIAIYAFVFSALLYFSSLETASNNIFFAVQYFTFFLLLANPLLGAKLLAEEFQQKTHVLLLASPIHSLSIVLAKFLAVVVFFLLLLLLTVFPPLLSLQFFTAATLPGNIVLLALLQFSLLGTFAIAVGFFCSGLTESVFFASIIAIFMVLFFYLLSFFAKSIPTFLRQFFLDFSIATKIENFNAGMLVLHDVLYFFLHVVFWVAASLYLFERQRWKA